MATIYLDGADYIEHRIPNSGGVDHWTLTGWKAAWCLPLTNGAGNPFLKVPNSNEWAVQMAPRGVVILGANQAADMSVWLKTFSKQDCPVDHGDIQVVNLGGGSLTFSKVGIAQATPPALQQAGNMFMPAAAMPGPTAPPPSSQQVAAQVTAAIASVNNMLYGTAQGNLKADFVIAKHVKKAMGCECGAEKTYQAGPGSSLHSGWCAAAKK